MSWDWDWLKDNMFVDLAKKAGSWMKDSFTWPGESESSSDYYKLAKLAKEQGMTVEKNDKNSVNEPTTNPTTEPTTNPTTEPTTKPEYSDAYKEYLDYTNKFESGYKTALDGTDETRALDAKAAEYYGLQDEKIKEYLGRDAFSYDVNTDKMYAMYRDQYLNDAKLAQQDATAQAAGLTGGYGSSYASSMGNQAYNGVMQRFDDKAAELYENAYNRYLNEGQEMLNAAALYGQQADNASSRSQGIKQQMLTDAAAAGEYANYMYQKSPEYENLVAEEKDSQGVEDALATLNKKFADGTEITTKSGHKYKINDDDTGMAGIADAIDFYADMIRDNGAESYNTADDFIDEIYARLDGVLIGGASLSEYEKAAIVDNLMDMYGADLQNAKWFEK